RLIAVYRIEASRKIRLPPGTKFVVADLIGAGGGGGSNSTTVQPGYASAAQGGNSGSRVVAKFDGYEGQEIDVTIGAGGTGGVAIGISAGINSSGGNNARGNGAGGSGAVSIYGTGSTGVSMPGGAGANGLAILWVYG
ncbi:TPA: hypothetical protein JJN00_005126, partial [Citrobacter freundii]|nr:hypothetical protein [Citrobacter freundii]HAW7144488.1 hypothetical protein [Citrobacter freundii]